MARNLYFIFLTCFLIPLSNLRSRCDAKSRTQRYADPFIPRFIGFDSRDAQIDIAWDVSVPFISIPLNHEDKKPGEPMPLLNFNPKGLSIAGLLTLLTTSVVPLFVTKTHPEVNYRSETDNNWMDIGYTLNNFIQGDNNMTPCIQRIVCSVISNVRQSDNPSSTEKIIDGLSSHKWFNQVVNGTIIEEAIAVGRSEGRDCSRTYKNCQISSRVVQNLIQQFGMV